MNPLLAEWENEAKQTRKILERVPEDKLEWKPHAKSKSLGELALHIATLPTSAKGILEQEMMDFSGQPRPPPKSKQEILDQFDALNAQLVELLKKPVDMNLMWTFKVQGNTIFTLPRSAAIRAMLFSHLIHHRGQLTVYLRLLDVPIPGMYGPSADER